MFDGLLGCKFSNKCKSKLKCIKLRIGPIKNKKQTVVKIQRKDVADLLAAGHQEKAFARIDNLSTDTNLVHCYEMIEQSCEFIRSQLPILQKQRECPDEVAEAMSTLIYAAARFPDLPELCDLRYIFIERYGNNIELYVNSEFMKKVQKKSLSKEEKLQITQEIADEFSVRWNIKEFDQKSHIAPMPKADYEQKSFSSHTKIEEPSPVHGTLKRETQSMLKVKPDSVKITKQVQVQNDIHVVPTSDVMHLTEPAQYVELHPNKTSGPPYTQARKQNSSLKDDSLGTDLLGSRAPRVHDEPDNTGLEHGKYQLKSSNYKSVNLVPPYTKPNVQRNQYHIEETSEIEIDPHHSRPKYDVEEKIQDGDEKEELRVLHNKGRATNMIPPYVKPRHNDQLKNTDFGASVDDRPKSMRTVQKPTVISSNNDNVLDDEKPTGYRSTLRSGNSDKESTEKIAVTETRRTSEHEEDSSIYYGKLLSQISSRQRRHDDYDEHEMFMLAYYSNKGTNRVPRKDRTSAKNSTMNDVNVSADRIEDYKHHVRRASVPLEPVTKLEVDKLTARVATMQPDSRKPSTYKCARY